MRSCWFFSYIPTAYFESIHSIWPAAMKFSCFDAKVIQFLSQFRLGMQCGAINKICVPFDSWIEALYDSAEFLFSNDLRSRFGLSLQMCANANLSSVDNHSLSVIIISN